jgi:hypothetical protein
MCPHSQPVRLNRISSRPVRAVAAARRVRVRVVLRVAVRAALLALRVLLAPRAQRQAAHRTSPGAGAAGVAAAASPAAAGVVVHWISQRAPRR